MFITNTASLVFTSPRSSRNNNTSEQTTMGLAALCCALLIGMCCAHNQLKTMYEWRSHEFVFPSPSHRLALINQGVYLPNASVPLDVDVYNGRVFITTPRFRKGVPATLSTISNEGRPESPYLAPYPDWSWHKPGHCDGLTSVFRVTVDECGRLWALDTGSTDIFTGIKHTCPKQIVVFDLSNDKMLHRHRFPTTVLKPDSIMTSIQVEVMNRERKCRATYAYVTDTTTYGLVVFDLKNDRSWRVTDNTFWPIPRFGHYQLQGSEFDLMDGILGISLTHSKPRVLYYHSLASNTENHVPTSVLQNEANFANNGNTVRSQFKTYHQLRKGQSAAEDISTDGILFYSELVDTTLKCFNTRMAYKGINNPTVATDLQRLQFASGMKVRKNKKGVEEVWVLTDRLQKLMVGTMTDSEMNFRVLKGNVQELIAGTECAGTMTGSHVNFIGQRTGEDEEAEGVAHLGSAESTAQTRLTTAAQQGQIVFKD